MPELPDVEIFRRYAAATSLHKKIKSLDVNEKRILKGASPASIDKKLRSQAFTDAVRYGKNLFLRTTADDFLHMHFGMSGSLKYYKEPADDLEYARFIVHFQNKYHLAWLSRRKLGKVSLETGVEDYVKNNKLGPDAMSIAADQFRNAAEKSGGSLKSFLMNQNKIAGIGNIYADEILFHSRMHPETQVKKLTSSDLKKLHQNIRKVLRYAISHDADPGKFGKNYLLPNRSAKKNCPACSGPVKKISISGRSSYYCPACQKK